MKTHSTFNFETDMFVLGGSEYWTVFHSGTGLSCAMFQIHLEGELAGDVDLFCSDTDFPPKDRAEYLEIKRLMYKVLDNRGPRPHVIREY